MTPTYASDPVQVKDRLLNRFLSFPINNLPDEFVYLTLQHDSPVQHLVKDPHPIS